MKLFSFDVGIKHLAVCCLNVQDLRLAISSWRILDLSRQDVAGNEEIAKCDGKIQSKRKSESQQSCGKKAKYFDTSLASILYYCEIHAKRLAPHRLVPSKMYRLAELRKMEKEALLKMYRNLDQSPPHHSAMDENMSKTKLVELISQIYSCRQLNAFKVTKPKASAISLIDIGKNIKANLDRSLAEEVSEATNVIIENQISPIASRMKTVQGMLAQYFLMRCNETLVVEFISSLNKLNHFLRKTEVKPTNDNEPQKVHYCCSTLTLLLLLFDFIAAPLCLILLKAFLPAK